MSEKPPMNIVLECSIADSRVPVSYHPNFNHPLSSIVVPKTIALNVGLAISARPLCFCANKNQRRRYENEIIDLLSSFLNISIPHMHHLRPGFHCALVINVGLHASVFVLKKVSLFVRVQNSSTYYRPP